MIFICEAFLKKVKVDGSSEVDRINGVTEFFFDKSSYLIKFGPLAIGFLIFLIYFCQNNFFPSFDFFSLTSLLLAAFVIGLAAYLVLVFGIAAPGFFWFDTFVKDRQVSDELGYSNLWRSACKSHQNFRMLGRAYFLLPLLFFNLFFIWVLTADYIGSGLKGVVSIAVLFFLTIICAVEIRVVYELSFGSLVKYVVVTLFSIFISCFINFLVVLIIVKAHAESADDSIQMLLAVGVTIALSLVFFVSAISGLTSHKYTVFFGALFAILFSLIAGAWAVLPKNIIRILGVGNYVAEEVVLDKDACSDFKVTFEGVVGDECVIRNAKIIWSLGEMYRLELPVVAPRKVISIPSGSVAAIATLEEE